MLHPKIHDVVLQYKTLMANTEPRDCRCPLLGGWGLWWRWRQQMAQIKLTTRGKSTTK